jgi:hypothetical protein
MCSEPIHAPGILEDTLAPDMCLGPVDPATVETPVEEQEQKQHDIVGTPPIHRVLNIDDFEVIAHIACPASNLRKSHSGRQLPGHGHTIPPRPTMNSVSLQIHLNSN